MYFRGSTIRGFTVCLYIKKSQCVFYYYYRTVCFKTNFYTYSHMLQLSKDKHGSRVVDILWRQCEIGQKDQPSNSRGRAH